MSYYENVSAEKIVWGVDSLNEHLSKGWKHLVTYEILQAESPQGRFAFLLAWPKTGSTTAPAPSPSTKPEASATDKLGDLLNKVTWHKGQYGEYAFAQNKDGSPNDGTILAEIILTQDGKVEHEGYMYTHKKDSPFINRKEA